MNKECTDHARRVYRSCTLIAQVMHVECTGHAVEVYRSCTLHFECTCYIWGYTGHALEVYRSCTQHVECTGHVCGVYKWSCIWSSLYRSYTQHVKYTAHVCGAYMSCALSVQVMHVEVQVVYVWYTSHTRVGLHVLHVDGTGHVCGV